MKSFITSTVIKRLDGDDNLFNKVGRREGGGVGGVASQNASSKDDTKKTDMNII